MTADQALNCYISSNITFTMFHSYRILTAASVPEYVGASKRMLSPGLMSISNTCKRKDSVSKIAQFLYMCFVLLTS